MGYQTVGGPCGNGRGPKASPFISEERWLEEHFSAGDYRNCNKNQPRDHHPEVPAHHATHLMSLRRHARASKDDRPGPPPFEARPAEEAGRVPQGDGYESLQILMR
jgi:hypothetical protein